MTTNQEKANQEKAAPGDGETRERREQKNAAQVFEHHWKDSELRRDNVVRHSVAKDLFLSGWIARSEQLADAGRASAPQKAEGGRTDGTGKFWSVAELWDQCRIGGVGPYARYHEVSWCERAKAAEAKLAAQSAEPRKEPMGGTLCGSNSSAGSVASSSTSTTTNKTGEEMASRRISVNTPAGIADRSSKSDAPARAQFIHALMMLYTQVPEHVALYYERLFAAYEAERSPLRTITEEGMLAAAKEIWPDEHDGDWLEKECGPDMVQKEQQSIVSILRKHSTQLNPPEPTELQLLRGALRAQDERETKAGELCGIPRERFGCDWPDAVAEEVLSLRRKLEQAQLNPEKRQDT